MSDLCNIRNNLLNPNFNILKSTGISPSTIKTDQDSSCLRRLAPPDITAISSWNERLHWWVVIFFSFWRKVLLSHRQLRFCALSVPVPTDDDGPKKTRDMSRARTCSSSSIWRKAFGNTTAVLCEFALHRCAVDWLKFCIFFSSKQQLNAVERFFILFLLNGCISIKISFVNLFCWIEGWGAANRRFLTGWKVAL